jgi:hypothetical protein
MTDPDDLMQRMADCIHTALEIIDADADGAQEWVKGAQELMIEYDDFTRLKTLKPAGREQAIIVPVIGGREARNTRTITVDDAILFGPAPERG